MEIKIVKQILAWNEDVSREIRASLAEQKICLVNIMGSPGGGKTSLIKALIEQLRGHFRIAVIEADIAGRIDAEAISALGIPVVQLQTDGACHIEAQAVREMLPLFPLDQLDVIFIENVGNLVCPAEFDTGADLNAVLLSVPEGDDKPLKYPLMFTVADVLLVTKCDAAPLFDFDTEALAQRARALNPGLAVIPVSAVTGEGLDAWLDWLCAAVKAKRLNAEAPAEAASEGRIGREGH